MDFSNPTTQAMIGGVIRAILVAGGGAFFTGDQAGQIAGALAVLIGIGWSIWAHKKTGDTTVSHATLTAAVQATAATPAAATEIIQAAKAGQF